MVSRTAFKEEQHGLARNVVVIFGVGQINGAMGQLNKATQQNASASEELAATAEEMRGHVEEMEELLQHFRV